MNLGCNETNELFLVNNGKTKYVLGEFDAMHTIGTNNLMMFINNIPNGSNVLDVGSGDGHYGKYLFDKGCTVLEWK